MCWLIMTKPKTKTATKTANTTHLRHVLVETGKSAQGSNTASDKSEHSPNIHS